MKKEFARGDAIARTLLVDGFIVMTLRGKRPPAPDVEGYGRVEPADVFGHCTHSFHIWADVSVALSADDAPRA